MAAAAFGIIAPGNWICMTWLSDIAFLVKLSVYYPVMMVDIGTPPVIIPR